LGDEYRNIRLGRLVARHKLPCAQAVFERGSEDIGYDYGDGGDELIKGNFGTRAKEDKCQANNSGPKLSRL